MYVIEPHWQAVHVSERCKFQAYVFHEPPITNEIRLDGDGLANFQIVEHANFGELR
jgi:hypothetical protein